MVGNMASIFTQVYIANVTPIYTFFPHLLHALQYTSLSLLWAHVDIFLVVFICSCHGSNVQWDFCLPFFLMKVQQPIPLQSQIQSENEFTSVWFVLLKSPMWNVGIHYVDVHKIPEDVLICFDWEAANIWFHAQLIMKIYTIHVSVVQLNVLWMIHMDHIMTKPPL